MLSRRDFLRFAGISLGIASLPDWFPALLKASDPLYGRALVAAPVYATPNTASAIQATLWPDNIVTLQNTITDWFQTPQGYVQRHNIQPISPPDQQSGTPTSYNWAAVSAPVAPVWQWCGADAPLITRIGHGGIAWVNDTLPGWIQLADHQHQPLGWSPMQYWQAIQQKTEPLNDIHLQLNNYTLTVLYKGDPLFTARVASDSHLPQGTFGLQRQHIGGVACCTSDNTTYHGAAWQLSIEDMASIISVYWHNNFGSIHPGAAIQVQPVLGQWLYNHIGPQSTLTIHHNL